MCGWWSKLCAYFAGGPGTFTVEDAAQESKHDQCNEVEEEVNLPIVVTIDNSDTAASIDAEVAYLATTAEAVAEEDENAPPAHESWGEENRLANGVAAWMIRRKMPVEVAMMTEAQLAMEITPMLAQRFKWHPVLMLLRATIADLPIEQLASGVFDPLTTIECRALHHVLKAPSAQWSAKHSRLHAARMAELVAIAGTDLTGRWASDPLYNTELSQARPRVAAALRTSNEDGKTVEQLDDGPSNDGRTRPDDKIRPSASKSHTHVVATALKTSNEDGAAAKRLGDGRGNDGWAHPEVLALVQVVTITSS
ncbi:hypothetical protein BBJ28_00001247 [Nothophytophthora sp. Chile5]|nr:hypothetical protein BBJ28_00001247 [Nothophytophthora sp. Chile5]